MDELVDTPHRAAAARLRQILAIYERQRDLLLMGAYREGLDPDTDEAIERFAEVEAFLRQDRDQRVSPQQTRKELIELFS
jgi:flagellar biosynthesis/type III secretory pathway ATPase